MLNLLKSLFPEFEFSESKIGQDPCYHGVINVVKDTEKVGKARVTYGCVHIFISSEMYKGTDKSFFYGMVYQHVHIIPYRKKLGSNLEAYKKFASNKDCATMIQELKEKTNLTEYKF